MKIKAILSLIFFMGLLSLIQSQLQSPETIVVDAFKCINNGKIVKGYVISNSRVNISNVDSQPINGSCSDGSTLLEPGVLLLLILFIKSLILLNKINY